MTDPTRAEVAELLEKLSSPDENDEWYDAYSELRCHVEFLARQYVTGPLGAEAMKRAAHDAAEKAGTKTEMVRIGDMYAADGYAEMTCQTEGLDNILEAIDALPFPSPADLLTAALALPEVRKAINDAHENPKALRCAECTCQHGGANCTWIKRGDEPSPASHLSFALSLKEIAALVEAVERLNAACDAMWNDHERLVSNSTRFGQAMEIKNLHIKAISEAQQALPAALAALKGDAE